MGPSVITLSSLWRREVLAAKSGLDISKRDGCDGRHAVVRATSFASRNLTFDDSEATAVIHGGLQGQS